MAETLTVRCDDGAVLFTFYGGPGGLQMVEVTIGKEQRRMSLGRFCQDMFTISELAAARSRRHINKPAPR